MKISSQILPKIAVASPMLSGNEKKYVMDCMDSTWISSAGKYIREFETAFAQFCGVKHAIGINNGTTSLHVALVALGVGPGDEVIVPSVTYIATANAVTYCGATPVLVDCDPDTLNIDPVRIAAAITPRTKGIIPVHLYGHPADMDPILDLAKAHGLFVLEDAAEAHGARYKGRVVGSIGDCASFSFFGNKILTCGEGGMVVTNDDALAARIRLFMGQGIDPNRRYWHIEVGYNYRMTNIQAAIGLAQLEQISAFAAQRKRLAGWYRERLLRLSPYVTMLKTEEWAESAFWMQTILLNEGGATERDDLILALDAAGIEVRPVFYPINMLPPYLRDSSPFPNAMSKALRGISLPTHLHLTENDVDRVCRSLAHALRASRLSVSVAAQ